MKVLLINSPYDLMSKGYSSKTKIKRGFFPPLGIGYLAAALIKNNFNVSVIDCVGEQLSIAETIERINILNPEIIGISVMTPGSSESYKLAEEIKKDFKNIKIIFGGPHANSFPEEILEKCPAADFVLSGEGEFTLPQLLKDINNPGAFDSIAGLFYRSTSGKIISKCCPEFIADIDKFPFPARNLFKNELYIPLPNFSKNLPATSVITSRGCPYSKCKFCYQSGKYSSKYRRRSVNNVIEELKILTRDYNIKEIAFYDSLFGLNEKWITELCDKMKNENINISWSCFAQISSVTKKMLERMADAGCFNIYYGIETADKDLLDFIRKNTNPAQIKEVIDYTHKLNIETRGSFIIGLPGSNPEKDNKTIKFAVSLNLDYAGFFPYRVYKGTALADEAHLYGTILADRAEGHHDATYFPNEYGSVENVKKMVKYAYRKFYFRPGYFFKVLKKIKSLNDFKRVYAGFKLLLGFAS